MNQRTQPTLFASLLYSCVRFSFYAEIVKTQAGRAFAFLSLLSAIAAISFTVYVYQVLVPSLERASDKLPVMMVKNGKVSVETQGEEPQSSNIYSDPQKVLRIDLDLGNSKQAHEWSSEFDYNVLITKYTIVIKHEPSDLLTRLIIGEVHALGLPYGTDHTLHKNSVAIFLDSWLWLILLLVFLGSFAFFWALKLAQAFLLTIPGLVIWGIMRRELTYAKLYTMSIYSLAPATLVSVLILVLNTQFALPQELLQYQWIIYFVVALEFLIGGIVAVPQPGIPKPEEKTLTERMF